MKAKTPETNKKQTQQTSKQNKTKCQNNTLGDIGVLVSHVSPHRLRFPCTTNKYNFR